MCGASEVTNHALINMIHQYTMTQQDEWAQYLPLFDLAYNSVIHATTTIAPFITELMCTLYILLYMLLPTPSQPRIAH